MSIEKLYARKSKKPLKAIRLFCFECMGMDRREKKPKEPHEDVKGCTDLLCPLYDFRFGKNPHIKKAGRKPVEALKALEKKRKKKNE